jgi:hypothetical protein
MITDPQTIYQILANAVMNNIKTILVEGSYDIKKYESILSNSENIKDGSFCDSVKVIPIETIAKNTNNTEEMFYVGCEGIISALLDLDNNILQHKADINAEKYILGIIDKDIRNHRENINPIPINNKLFLLPYYSIESFYINEESVRIILKKSINSISLIDNEIVSDLFNNSLNDTIDFLFYPVLDAYLKATDSNHSPLAGYEFEYGYVKEKLKKDEYTAIKELNKQIIKKDISTFLDICKGKWFLECWVEKLIDRIKNLSNLCRNKKIKQCQYCAIKKYENKCQYKVHLSSLKKELFFDDIFLDQDFTNPKYEFLKIIHRFNQMYS